LMPVFIEPVIKPSAFSSPDRAHMVVVACIHPDYVWTKRGDVGTTSPTVLARQEPLPKRSKHRFASLQHYLLIIAEAWNGCSMPSSGVWSE
jgi:hypothetical protein